MDTKKVAYEAPEVVAHGSFEQITAGGHAGSKLDAAFPADTPIFEVTIS
jgi:hypothetical protein